MGRDKKISVVEDLEPQILESIRIECPKCGADIRADAKDKDEIVCFCCNRKIRVKDRAGEKVQLIQETLWMPKGSVRAIITLLISATCWILVVKGDVVPKYLFNLLIAVISYYFAFRKKDSFPNMSVTKTPDEFADVTASGQTKPLYLPGGLIRFILIAGFAFCGIMVLKEEVYKDPDYLEFFVILAGLVLGYFFARFADMFRKDAGVYNGVTHVKGVIVLIAALFLAVILLSDLGSGEFRTRIPLLCACIVTFYFGSKS